MFNSTESLAGEIRDLLGVIRRLADGRYAALLEPGRILFEESEQDASGSWTLRHFLEQRTAAVFAIPAGLAGDGPAEDVFAGWDEDEFFLAFINGRVALVVACPDAEPLRELALPPLRALADRLLRFDERYRFDAQGHGLFVGRAKLDLVVIGRAQD